MKSEILQILLGLSSVDPAEAIAELKDKRTEKFSRKDWGDIAEYLNLSTRWADEEFYRDTHDLDKRQSWRVVAYAINDKKFLYRTVIALFSNYESAKEFIEQNLGKNVQTLIGIEQA